MQMQMQMQIQRFRARGVVKDDIQSTRGDIWKKMVSSLETIYVQSTR